MVSILVINNKIDTKKDKKRFIVIIKKPSSHLPGKHT